MSEQKHTGIIAWFARNSVAANLLMIVILAIGLYSAMTIQRAIQPRIETNVITVAMAYPGAAPEEVERGIVFKIEESLKDIESIKRVDSTARESFALLSLEIYDGFDVLAVLDEVKSAVDSVNSFPEQAEKPLINRQQFRDHVINIQVYGRLEESEMKALTEQIKGELLQDPGIAYAEIFGDRNYEVAVEIDEVTLREYQLTLGKVATAIRNSSLNLPGGALKTDNGEIMLRTKGQAYNQRDFENILLMSFPDGTRLTLGDIATVKDGFEERLGYALFDQQSSMAITVYAVGDQDLIRVADAAKRYIEKKRTMLPDGVHIAYWADLTHYLEGRLSMMIKNLTMGALLVFLILALFLNLKLAFWVMVGLPVCFLGTFALMPTEYVGITLNMISLFGFILVLGIVVDDAIIIGESVNHVTREKGNTIDSVIEGALRVAKPATFGVLTTIVAFVPTLMADGIMAAFPAAFGWVVILCLFFSLIESKWILPAHLAHSKPATKGPLLHLDKIPAYTNRKLKYFIETHYRPFLRKCIQHRYTTLAVFTALLIITIGIVGGGIVRYSMMPDIPSDFLRAKLEMIEGTGENQTRTAHQHISNALQEVNQQYIADSGDEQGFIRHAFSWVGDSLNANFLAELIKTENRSITSDEIADAWRDRIGEIPGAKVMSVSNIEEGGGPAIAFKLIAPEMETLRLAAQELQNHIASYDGTYDIRNGTSAVRDEILLDIKPEAESLGITRADLARQVRQAFYGAEAQRMQRGINEVKVMVRYPREDRENLANLQNMHIRTSTGDEVPFSSVATIKVAPGFSKTTRINGDRAITVAARADKNKIQPSEVVGKIRVEFLPELMQRYPGLSYKLDGESEETAKMFTSLMLGFALALFGIYTLLAIPLKSYSQPLIIMGVIPFGIIGAIIGHIVVDISFGMISFFGVIALSGVVVNDSLIMVDFVNTSVAKGMGRYEAIIQSGSDRFRAISLTSLTTFFGLLPMLLEDSLQAQIIIPMAVSLGFGIVFATVITLLLVPCLYMVLDDIARLFGKKSIPDNTKLDHFLQNKHGH